MKLITVSFILMLFFCLICGKAKEGECCGSMKCNYQGCNTGLFCEKKDPSGQFWWMGGLCRRETISGCRCGLVQRRSRILGGIETEVNEYPWMVMMLRNGQGFCGGSLISSGWVLSAAHCFRSIPRLLQARLGEHDVTRSDESDHIDIDITRIINHPDYNGVLNYDFSLLKLAEKVDFSLHPHIRPICLPTSGESTFQDLVATATGWGRTENALPSEKLLEVNLYIISNEKCNPMVRGGVTDQMLCANVTRTGTVKSTHRGDSGGPLIVPYSDTVNYQLIGVTSGGNAKVSVYARVTEQLKWISDTADGLSGTCPK